MTPLLHSALSKSQISLPEVGILHIYTGKVCDFCLWILSVTSPALLTLLCGYRDPCHFSKEKICVFILTALCFTLTLLQHWIVWDGMCELGKQGLKMQFLYLATVRMN